MNHDPATNPLRIELLPVVFNTYLLTAPAFLILKVWIKNFPDFKISWLWCSHSNCAGLEVSGSDLNSDLKLGHSQFFSQPHSPINVKITSLKWNSVLASQATPMKSALFVLLKIKALAKKDERNERGQVEGWKKQKVSVIIKLCQICSQSCSTSLICLIPSGSSWYNFVIFILSSFSDLTCWWSNFELLCLKI